MVHAPFTPIKIGGELSKDAPYSILSAPVVTEINSATCRRGTGAGETGMCRPT